MEGEVPVTPGALGPSAFHAVEETLRRAVRERVFPGAAFCAGDSSGVKRMAGVGFLDYSGRAAASPSTVYDLASLTKVVAAATVAARLVEAGRLSLAAPVSELVPGFQGGGREAVQVEHLLTHSSGLPAWKPLYREARSQKEALAVVLATPLEGPPGKVERYSDLGVILLGECLARAGGKPLAALSWELVLDPLSMRDTCFRPPEGSRWRIAPTEEDRELRGRLIHGEVHDENCHAMGGVSGHAGLFSTAEDLARFALEMLRSVLGSPGPRFLKRETARRFTSRRGLVEGSSRALGWDTRSDEEDGTGPAKARSSSGRMWSPGSFGHTGFTGTSIWLDPALDRFAVLLSNRVHPSRAGDRMLEVRREFHDAVAEAMGGGGAGALHRAIRDLADAWFVIEVEGQPAGYHRMAVRRTADGGVAASDEMAILPGAGGLSFRSEVTTGADLLDPRRARCETRHQGSPAMRGTIEMEGETMTLGAEVFLNEFGLPLVPSRKNRSSEKRPGSKVLFQSLVPLLLLYLPEGEDGSGLGELVLGELPADPDRLVAWKPGRRLSISRAEGGGRRVAVRHEGKEALAATLRLGPKGELQRIEMERFVERRVDREEARRVVPGAFPE